MSIYSEALEKVENGEPFRIDFEKRTMKIGKELVVNNGEYDATKPVYEAFFFSQQDLLRIIKEKYKQYKYSLPSERSDNKRRKYFKALPVEELTDEELILGTPREVAQFKLEALILLAILNGDFVWDEELHGKWFYQDSSESDLVILRSWVEGK